VTSSTKQSAAHEPLFDVHPQTGVSIEVFYSDRTPETFGRGGAGWFWWSRQRGYPPAGAATGPFPTGYVAYRHAMNAATSSSSVTHGAEPADPQR
jgi:hypothetical protein